MSFVRILKLNPLNAFQIRTLYRNLVSGNSDNYDQPDIKLVTQIRKIKNFNSSCKDSYTCIQVDCKLNCKGSKKPLAFINKTTGTFTCPSCEFNENLSTIFPLYDNQSGSAVKSSLLQALKLKANDAKNQGFYTPKDHPILINALPEHFTKLKLSISELVLNNLNATFDAEQSSWHFPLKNAADVVVGEKVLRLNGKEITFPPDCSSGILKYSHSQKECTKAVVVLNVVDFLALCSQKLDAVDVICLPHWLKTLPQQCLPNFEFYKQLILWFDFDNAGWDATRYFARKLDERRCLFIRPTDEQPTPFTAINQKLNLKSIIAKAQPILHKSITTFSALKQDVLCELQNVEKVNGVKWKRFPVLNKLLKGHRKGELTILTGPTGCGKTTFMSEYSLDLAMQGVSTLWGSFEIRNTRLAATIMRQFVGYPLDDKLEEFEHWAKQIEQLPMYYMTFHGQQSIKVVMEAIEHAQYVHDIQHVIIDNVQFMLGISSSSRQDKFWEQDTVIAAFRTFATKRNVHVTLVMHPRKEKDTDDLTTSSIFGSAKATQEADNVYIIQDKRLTSIRGRKFLQVAKNRYSGDLGMMPLEFNKDGLSYAPKKTKSSI